MSNENFKPERLKKVKVALLLGKTWRYLRYIHAREALLLAKDVRSVLVVGAGHGMAEIALALEFPHITFKLTDWGGASHNRTHSETWIHQWDIKNVCFGVLNILDEPAMERFDMVYSVEVLEHIEDDATAAANMCKLSNKYVFCLVPFAQEELNDNVKRRAEVFAKNEHFVCGYNYDRLLKLFGKPVATRGVYWSERGGKWRQSMKEMSLEDIANDSDRLMLEAMSDIVPKLPMTTKEALGIWWLTKMD
jgi:SAM-dependent methyltransferase